MLLFPNSAAKQAQREKQKVYARQLQDQIKERDVLRKLGTGMRGAGYNVVAAPSRPATTLRSQNEVGLQGQVDKLQCRPFP